MWCVTPVNPGSYGRVTELVPDSFLHVNAIVEDAAHGDWCQSIKCMTVRPDASNEHRFTVHVLRARRAPCRSLSILLKPRVARARDQCGCPTPHARSRVEIYEVAPFAPSDLNRHFAFSSSRFGLPPAPRTLTNFCNKSNQNGAPRVRAVAVNIQPKTCIGVRVVRFFFAHSHEPRDLGSCSAGEVPDGLFPLQFHPIGRDRSVSSVLLITSNSLALSTPFGTSESGSCAT